MVARRGLGWVCCGLVFRSTPIRSLSGKAFDPSAAEAFLALAAEGRIAGK